MSGKKLLVADRAQVISDIQQTNIGQAVFTLRVKAEQLLARRLAERHLRDRVFNLQSRRGKAQQRRIGQRRIQYLRWSH